MRIALILFLILVAGTGVASADFNNTLGIYGLDQGAQSISFKQVTGYTFSQEGETIAQVRHNIPYGTIVTERYYYGTQIINTRMICSWSWFTATCSLHVDNGIKSADGNWSSINLGVLGSKDVVTSVLNDKDGNIGFGLGVGTTPIPTLFNSYNVSIYIPELGNTPIQGMDGQASSPIDITVQSVTYETYADYVDKMNRLSPAEMEKNFKSGWQKMADLMDGITGFIYLIFIDHPILTFAFIEIFALMASMNAKDMVGWWRKYIDVHYKAYDFVIKNISWILGIFAVATVVGGFMKLVAFFVGG